VFGLDNNVGKPAVEAAVEKLDPLLRDVEIRAAGILHSLLDRFEIDIKIKLNPPKATYANPPPKEN
jgi:hypothetical protein